MYNSIRWFGNCNFSDYIYITVTKVNKKEKLVNIFLAFVLCLLAWKGRVTKNETGFARTEGSDCFTNKKYS